MIISHTAERNRKLSRRVAEIDSRATTISRLSEADGLQTKRPDNGKCPTCARYSPYPLISRNSRLSSVCGNSSAFVSRGLSAGSRVYSHASPLSLYRVVSPPYSYPYACLFGRSVGISGVRFYLRRFFPILLLPLCPLALVSIYAYAQLSRIPGYANAQRAYPRADTQRRRSSSRYYGRL